MKTVVRRSAIFFAIASTIYWSFAAEFIETLRSTPEAFGLRKQSYLTALLSGTAIPVLYAVLCVAFFHWFARRILLASHPKVEDDVQ